MSPNSNAISVIGLGKLGSPLAVTLAYKGFRVIGLDLNPKFVDQINQGIAPVQEPNLQEMLTAARERLTATTSYREAVMNTQVAMIIVPTPTGSDGGFVLDYVIDAARQIGAVLATKNEYSLISIVSTVMPGDTAKIQQILEEASGKLCGPDFGVCYSPEFIALGSVIHNLLNPDMLLIGESDPSAGQMYEEILLQMVNSKPVVRRMNFINAEITKLAVNTFITTKITYANMLARICESLPGADADVVTGSVGLDSRIGQKYLKGAVAYGGPCFPRDNVALTRAAERAGTTAPIADTTHHYNREQHRLLAEMVLKYLPAERRISILGLSYKPDTPVVEESASLYLIKELLDRGCLVTVYDPLAMPEAERMLNARVTYAADLGEAVRSSDLIVIATPWKEFSNISNNDLARNGQRSVIIVDCWRMLSSSSLPANTRIVHLGVGPESVAQVASTNLVV